MKKCPFCAEEIQEEAVKCKHCGEFLIDAELKRMKRGGDGKWYHRTPTLVISILLIGPLALPLVWFNPRYSITTKIIATIVVVAATVALTVLMVGLYAHLLEQIQKMGL
jgi:uncharacterized membrane protein YvbJ